MKKIFLLFSFSLLFLLLKPSNCYLWANPKGTRNSVLVIPIQDKMISPPIANFVHLVLKKAYNYKAVVFLIDTPGGFLTSCEQIVKDILACPVPTIAFIWPNGARAGSAGVFIALACDFVAMAPDTRIGAAHPILMSQTKGSIMQKILSEKILNDTLAFFRSYVSQKHKNLDIKLCEELVTKSKSLTAKEAFNCGIADVICNDLHSLINTLEEKGRFPVKAAYDFVYARMKPIQTVMYYITNPYLLYVLSSMSFILLLFEFTHPGFGMPGIIGLIGLGVCMYGYGILPVNYFGLFLTLLGLLFCIAEVFVGSFGLLAISGLICIIWGALLVWSAPGVMFRISYGFVLSAGILLGLISMGVVYVAIKIKKKKPMVGHLAMVNSIGEAVEDINDRRGKVFVNGEYWNATTESGIIKKGERVVITKVNGLNLLVKKAEGRQ